MCRTPACQQLPYQDPLKRRIQAVPSGKLAMGKQSPPLHQDCRAAQDRAPGSPAGSSTVSGAIRHHRHRLEEVSHLIHSCRGVLSLGM